MTLNISYDEFMVLVDPKNTYSWFRKVCSLNCLGHVWHLSMDSRNPKGHSTHRTCSTGVRQRRLSLSTLASSPLLPQSDIG